MPFGGKADVRTTVNQGGEDLGWRGLTVFEGIGQDVLDQLEAAMDPVSYAPDEVLIRQGDLGDEMFLVTEGSVRVVANRTMAGTRFELDLKAPALVGEMAVITREPRTATVMALTRTKGLRIGRAAFEALIATYPRVARFLTAVVGRRLMEAKTIVQVGKYRIIKRLGSGTQATVFEAEQENLGRIVALKMLSHDIIAGHPEFARKFEEEARVIARLDHPNIVRVFDTVEAFGTRFIVMERLKGATLSELIDAGADLGWDAIRIILREILLALDSSHREGLLHRDVKPSNVFLTADRKVKILDFGLAVEDHVGRLGFTRLQGTPLYMAPEQIAGQPIDGRADQYAAGILAFHLVTGDVPFRSTDIEGVLKAQLLSPVPEVKRLVADVPADIAAFIRRATSKDLRQRFPNCGEAARFLGAEPEDAALDPGAPVATMMVSYPPDLRDEVELIIGRLTDELAIIPGVDVKVEIPPPKDY